MLIGAGIGFVDFKVSNKKGNRTRVLISSLPCSIYIALSLPPSFLCPWQVGTVSAFSWSYSLHQLIWPSLSQPLFHASSIFLVHRTPTLLHCRFSHAKHDGTRSSHTLEQHSFQPLFAEPSPRSRELGSPLEWSVQPWAPLSLEGCQLLSS